MYLQEVFWREGGYLFHLAGFLHLLAPTCLCGRVHRVSVRTLSCGEPHCVSPGGGGDGGGGGVGLPSSMVGFIDAFNLS